MTVVGSLFSGCDGMVPGVSRTAQLRILGNSCQPQVAAAATESLLYSALKAIRHASASM